MTETYSTKFKSDIESELRSLVRRIANGCRQSDAFGTFTPACYDTAWVAMVTKEVDGKKKVLFPQCLSYLLQEQAESGGWGETEWPVDAILNSLAALLCLATHRDSGVDLEIPLAELDKRIDKAQSFLSSSLQDWDAEACNHVGFEILIPALFAYLSKHGIRFNFPGKTYLQKANSRKLSKFDARYIYKKQTTTLVHSLEAFIGIIDFNKIGHHLRGGAMLGSPAATAAYLMHSEPWSESAESYLKKVSTFSIGKGGIPSAFPSPIFESSWALCVILSSGVRPHALNKMGARDIVERIRKTLYSQNGIVGFAPEMLADADDTAKCLQLLSQSKESIGPEAMINEFTSDDCFRTFRLETSPSFSANCNVLLALLAQPKPSEYATHISKATTFLLDAWEQGPVADKWNMSPIFSFMLFSETIKALLTKWDKGELDDWTDEMIRKRLAIVALDVAKILLPSQEPNGSWDDSNEVTAYAVLTFSHILCLPLDIETRKMLKQASNSGREYLRDNKSSWTQPDHLWVEKVSYGSPILSESYCLAAVMSSISELDWSEQARQLFLSSESYRKKMSDLCCQLALSKACSPEELQLPIAQSYHYLQRLQKDIPQLFPQAKSGENEYLSIVPFTWILSSYIHNNSLPGKVLWDMMQLSVLVYQVDEYMESTVVNLSSKHLTVLENVIRSRCGCMDTWVRSASQHANDSEHHGPEHMMSALIGDGLSRQNSGQLSSHEDFENLGFGAVANVIDGLISYVLDRPSLVKAESSMRQYVMHELCGFLLAHIHHIRNNAAFSQEEVDSKDEIKCFTARNATYHDWVNSVASDDTSCPFAFAYLCCLLSKDGKNPLEDVASQYLAKSLCRHLAIMCRQYNDFGSLTRDTEESNLNGLNFPEFKPEIQKSIQVGKQTMMKLAEYERKCLNVTVEELRRLTEGRLHDALCTFIDVTDLYGQLYVIKDLTNRVK